MYRNNFSGDDRLSSDLPQRLTVQSVDSDEQVDKKTNQKCYKIATNFKLSDVFP